MHGLALSLHIEAVLGILPPDSLDDPWAKHRAVDFHRLCERILEDGALDRPFFHLNNGLRVRLRAS